MKFIKYSLLLILPVFFLKFMPELNAKQHHRSHKKTTKTSFSFNMNMDTGAPVYYSPGYTTVVTQYQPTYYEQVAVVRSPQPAYYEQVTVARPLPQQIAVQQVIVQPQPRPAVGLSFSPFFSFWSN